MSEKKTMYRPDVDAIRQLLQDAVKENSSIRFWPHGDVVCLTVDIYGTTNQGPVLDVADLKRIQDALVGSVPSADSDVFVSAGERPDDGWSYLRIQVHTAHLKSELRVEFEANA